MFNRPTGLALLFDAEDSMRKRCAVVASRLELAPSALVLLEVACHADAALDDIDTLASARGVALDTAASRAQAWIGSVARWVTNLWPASALREYVALLVEMRRVLAIGGSLRAASAAAGDTRMADWCALWTEQRALLANRLEATLAERRLPEATVDLYVS